jgi:CheY-like chemotaxis protein
MLPMQSTQDPREVRICFIDDDAPRLVGQFRDWWRNNRRPGVVVTAKPVSEPPWLDKATQKRIEEFKPDLIVLDLVLQKGIESGERVLRNLRDSEELKDIPVFVYSSHVSCDRTNEQRVTAEKKYNNLGAEGLFSKSDESSEVFNRLVGFALNRQLP